MAGGVKVSVAFSDDTLAASPTWTDITDGSSLVASYSKDAGRQFEFDKTDTGTARVAINDRDGILNPANSAGSYYGLIEPLLQIKIELYNPVADEWQTRFRGFIEDFDYTLAPYTHQSAAGATVGNTQLEINCVDLFEILTAIEMQPDGSFGDTLPGTVEPGNIFFDNATVQDRITQVLGNAGIPTGFYVVFTGNVYSSESVYSPSENVLQVIQDAADAEFPTVSNVYVDRFGRIVFHGRLAKFDPHGTWLSIAGTDAARDAVWMFRQWKAGDGKAVAASSSDTAHIRTFAYNRGLSKVFNSALSTPNAVDSADIAGQYVQDATSIAKYGYRSWSAENLFIAAPSGDPVTGTGAGILTGNSALDETKAYATYIINNYASPRNRISQIGFKSMRPTDTGAAANWALLCGVDVSDTVDVTIRAAGDSDTGYVFNAETFFVEGVHEEVTPLNGNYAMVSTTLDLSPAAYFTDGAGVTA